MKSKKGIKPVYLSSRKSKAIPSSRIEEEAFEAEDFLYDAIIEFLESGENKTRLISSIIKAAICTELVIKNLLYSINPVLILEKFNTEQIIELMSLKGKVRPGKELKNSKIKTARFPVILERADYFLDLAKIKSRLESLFEWRNEIVHHAANLNLEEITFLLSENIFPFLREHLKKTSHPLFTQEDIWEQLSKIAKDKGKEYLSQIRKKLTLHRSKANKLTATQRKSRLASPPVQYYGEEVIDTSLICPACFEPSLTIKFPVDFGDEGEPYAGPMDAHCRVCGLTLDNEEIETIKGFYGEFDKNGALEESWTLVFPDFSMLDYI